MSDHPAFDHCTVLLAETVDSLPVVEGGTYLDCTLGGGGHSEYLLSRIPGSRLWGLDQDPAALAAAGDRLARFGDRFTPVRTNFADFDPGAHRFDGILADLGVSSPQFDTPERGFSFRHDAPLDMRMNPEADWTAADLINESEQEEIARILYEYGEERLSRKIAAWVCEHRPLTTTTQLAEICSRAYPPKARYGRIHPATRTFQALRIAVNRELEVLETLLDRAPDWLQPGGALAIISFHSLEDRLVKHRFKNDERLRVITRKPLLPTEDECEANPRARSAKLRVAERRAADD